MRRATLLIFAKPPWIGVSKTRLAIGLGRTPARRIAAFTLARTLRAAKASGCEAIVCVAPDAAQRRPACFAGLPVQPQGSGGLTERLSRALQQAPTGPVLFIGADAPDISPARLRRAARVLHRHNAVFGPARDGGFWLFGLHKRAQTRPPFAGVRWSTPYAMEDVWSRLPPRCRVGLLDQLIDIDTADDWQDWSRRRR